MFTKRKSRIVTTILVVAILATMFAGYVSATEEKILAPRVMDQFFYLDLKPHGDMDLATPREKSVDREDALFYITYINNPTGYYCYLNVRDEDGVDIVGQTAAKLLDHGDCCLHAVKYLSWHGQVGVKYRPSGQTNSGAAVSARIEGRWTP